MRKSLLHEELTKMYELSDIEESDKQEEYQKFFNEKLKEFGVDSPAELDDEKKKEFFNAIDDGWTGEK